MKKHAKKSLLLPISILCFALAVFAACYISQAVFAHADANSTDAALTSETTTMDVSDPNAGSIRNIMARIHLSTNDPFSGQVRKSQDSEFVDFSSLIGVEYVTYEEVVKVNAKYQEDDGYVRIWAVDNAGERQFPVYRITMPSRFYEFDGININYDWSANVADISIVVSPKYYIGFSANGGKFYNGDIIKWVAQGEYNALQVPMNGYFPDEPVSDQYAFAGWYTEPWIGSGQQVFDGTQVPAWGELTMLYAHWIPKDSALNFHINLDDYGLFKYKLLDLWTGTAIDEGTTFSYDIPLELRPVVYLEDGYYFADMISAFEYDNSFGSETGTLSFMWQKNDYEFWYSLVISPMPGQRFTKVTHNGVDFPFEKANNTNFGVFNNFVISSEWEMPGFISVASDNGRMFECEVDYCNDAESGDITKTYNFVSDYVPIYVTTDEYVFYSYGRGNREMLNSSNGNSEISDVGFKIVVRNYKDDTRRVYKFRDNFVTLFDWFELNNYILGVNADGQALPQSDYEYYLLNGYHNFELKMSGEAADTTVTYNANGGKFAQDQDTLTFNVNYGDALPMVDNPVAIDNDFVGWFTEPEGGQQVDPANYNWKLSDRWTGVTLYAHWAYNPQPVPPEPGPTPEPVNPDVPGGGGAQTGDSMPFVPIAALAIVAALGCGLAIRKEF